AVSLVLPALAQQRVNNASNKSQTTPLDMNEGDPEAHLFSQKCSGCHTIGRGNMVGPDLDIVVSWASSDLEVNIKRMEKFVGALSADDVKDLVQLLKDPKAKDRLKAEGERAIAPQAGSEPASANVGHNLFCGVDQFKNGGLACISCHHIQGSGGTMGGDLTEVASKLGETALASACEEPSYPVMKTIYNNHPVTRQEALHLTKYFMSLPKEKPSQGDPPVGMLGTACAAALLGGIAFFYRHRNISVRTRLNRR
ncbi:MAG: cytochrome c, partial [Candidatus Melainabacteria bacterium]|nr:cytochrome c [Candidatus Melainabacteria bacterium]